MNGRWRERHLEWDAMPVVRPSLSRRDRQRRARVWRLLLIALGGFWFGALALALAGLAG